MRIAIQQAIQRSDESRYDHRLHGLLLVAGGQSCRQVAGLFDENPRTVQRWVKTFERQGFDGLREGDRSGRPRSLTPEQWSSLAADLRRRPDDFGLAGHLWDGKLRSERLRRGYGVKLGVRQCQRLFRQMGFRRRKPRPKLAPADPARVEAGKKTSPVGETGGSWTVEPGRMPLPAPRHPLPRVGAAREPGPGRPPRGGAVSLRSGKFVHAFSPGFNAVTFEGFLKILLRRRSRGRKMAPVLDNARYHHAKRLTPLLEEHQAHLELRFLPPYSPQLAPIERVWKLTRRVATHNLYFGNLDELLSAVESCFGQWRKPKSRLATIMRHYLSRYV